MEGRNCLAKNWMFPGHQAELKENKSITLKFVPGFLKYHRSKFFYVHRPPPIKRNEWFFSSSPLYIYWIPLPVQLEFINLPLGRYFSPHYDMRNEISHSGLTRGDRFFQTARFPAKAGSASRTKTPRRHRSSTAQVASFLLPRRRGPTTLVITKRASTQLSWSFWEKETACSY